MKREEKKQWQRIGYHLASGAGIYVGSVLFTIFLLQYCWPKDDTDRGWFHRSGLTPLTDHATGLQYLRSSNSLTPRLNREGQQIHE